LTVSFYYFYLIILVHELYELTSYIYIYAESETWMTIIPHTHTTQYTPNIWLRYSIKILFISITYTRNAGHVLQEMYVLHNVYVDELKQQK